MINADHLARLWQLELKRQRKLHEHYKRRERREGRYRLAREAERAARRILEFLGYHVGKQSHKAHYDLLACNDRSALRVEVKASTWNESKRRYQFNLRDNEFDVLIAACQNGSFHFFVIPADQIAGKTIDITSHDPDEYNGHLADYYQRWDLLGEMDGVNHWQLPLFD